MKVITHSFSTIYTCDVDGVTQDTVTDSTALPSGWKRAVVPVTPQQRAMGLRSQEKHIAPPSLGSSDPVVLAQIKDLLLP